MGIPIPIPYKTVVRPSLLHDAYTWAFLYIYLSYKTVVRPSLLHDAYTWATTRGQEAQLEIK